MHLRGRRTGLCTRSGCGLSLLLFLVSGAVPYGQEEEAPPPEPEPERQVIVSVKIIEFQMTKGVDTGFSAFLAKVPRNAPFGEVSTSGNAIESADLTFPTPTAAGITVFLDRIRTDAHDIEVVLQALVDENRAFILSQPRAMVKVGTNTVPTVIKTIQQIPYENTVVVGSTAVQVTTFEETGVTLVIGVPEVVDDDGDFARTQNDTYIHLDVRAEVKEEGQRIVVALDDQLAGGGDFSLARNAIQVPEFVSRSVETEVWVRDGQVLLLGGLYRNAESKSIQTLPWLSQAEDVAIGAAENVIPGNFFASPLSATLGSRSTSDSRRELVFMIKAELWERFQTLPTDFGLQEQRERGLPTPVDVITNVSEGISNVLQRPTQNSRDMGDARGDMGEDEEQNEDDAEDEPDE